MEFESYQDTFNSKLVIGLELLFLKIVYIYSIITLLPDDYLGFSFRKDIHLDDAIFELLPFAIGLYIYLHYYKRNGLGIFNTMLFTMAFIPANSGLCLSNNSYDFYFSNNIYIVLLMFFIGKYSEKIIEHKDIDDFYFMDFLSQGKILKIFRMLMITALSFKLYQIYSYNGLDISSIFVSEMYDVRADFADFYGQNVGSFFTYFDMILSTFSTWFILIYLYLSIKNKLWFDVLFSVFVSIGIFSLDMQKNSLVILLVVIYVAISSREKLVLLSEKIIMSFCIFFMLIIFLYHCFDSSFLFESIVQRMIYIPNYMVSIHYDCFKDAPKYIFTQDCFLLQNIFSTIIGKAYHTDTMSLVSDYYFKGLLPAPNTGLFAEAFAQIGYLGVLLFPVIHSRIVYLVYKFSRYFGLGACFVIMIKLFLKIDSVYILSSVYIVPLILFCIVTKYLYRFQKQQIS